MQLTQQQIDFIIDLSNEMRTQDTRCTAQPYGLILTEEVVEIRGEDYANCCAAHWNEHSYYDFKEFVDAVAEYYEDDENHPEWVNAINECSGFSDLGHELPMHQENNEPSIFWYERTQVPTLMNSNFFLTEKGYESYLKKNRHNITKPESYGIHLRRNDEMAQVIEVIHAIADQLKSDARGRTFTKKEVVEILIANNNKILKMVGDPDKYFVIEGDNVICKHKSFFGKDRVLNEYSFDYVIEEARL